MHSYKNIYISGHGLFLSVCDNINELFDSFLVEAATEAAEDGVSEAGSIFRRSSIKPVVRWMTTSYFCGKGEIILILFIHAFSALHCVLEVRAGCVKCQRVFRFGVVNK